MLILRDVLLRYLEMRAKASPPWYIWHLNGNWHLIHYVALLQAHLPGSQFLIQCPLGFATRHYLNQKVRNNHKLEHIEGWACSKLSTVFLQSQLGYYKHCAHETIPQIKNCHRHDYKADVFYVRKHTVYKHIKLEQLERQRSEDTPRGLMITHTIESCWIPQVKTR